MSRLAMLDKVVGHYAVVGTEEATEFLRLCDLIGIKWHNGKHVYNNKSAARFVCVYDDGMSTLSDQSIDTTDLYGRQLKPFTISTTSVGMIDAPFGAEYYISTSFGIQTWFKKSDGVILKCNAPKTPSMPQYPFWEVSTYPSLKVLEDSFGSSLHAIHELGVQGQDWVEMGR